MKESALVKYNGGRLALLCSKCRVIIKTGKDFTEEEGLFARGKIDYLPPRYCKDHESNSRIQPTR